MTTQDWHLKETPKFSYCLTAFEPGGDSILEIELTVEEYKHLKDGLARSRGLIKDDKQEEEPPRNPLLTRMEQQGFTTGQFMQMLTQVDPLGLDLLDDLIHGNQSAREGKELFQGLCEGLKEFADEHGLKIELA